MLEKKKLSSQRKAQVQVVKRKQVNQVVNPNSRRKHALMKTVLHVVEARNYSYASMEKTEAMVEQYV